MENLCPFCSELLSSAECSKLYAKGCDSINEKIKLLGLDITEVQIHYN